MQSANERTNALGVWNCLQFCIRIFHGRTPSKKLRVILVGGVEPRKIDFKFVLQ